MRCLKMAGLGWIPVVFSATAWAQAPAAPAPTAVPGGAAAAAAPGAAAAPASSAAPAPAAPTDAAPAAPSGGVVLPPQPPAPQPPAPGASPAPAQEPAAPGAAPPSVELSLSALNAPRPVERGDVETEAPLRPRNYAALPLLIDFRYGVSSRLSGAFDGAKEELWDSSFALGAALLLSSEIAGTLDVEHAGLGRVNALSGQSSTDASYSVTTGWLGLRAYPWHSERLDLFLTLRGGLAFEHVNAVGTRQSTLFTQPATTFGCSETADPGFAIGGGLGLIYRFSRHLSFVTRVDGNGYRVSGDPLGDCAIGLGATTVVGASIGVGYEFETTAGDSKSVARRD